MEHVASQKEHFQHPPIAVGPEEAGRLTAHSRSAIYNAIAVGSLRSFKNGKRRLILVSELHLWLNRLAKENSK